MPLFKVEKVSTFNSDSVTAPTATAPDGKSREGERWVKAFNSDARYDSPWKLLRDVLQWNWGWSGTPVFDYVDDLPVVLLTRGASHFRISEANEAEPGVAVLVDSGVATLLSSSARPLPVAAVKDMAALWADERPVLVHDHDGYLMVVFDDVEEVKDGEMARAEVLWRQHGGKTVYFYSFSPPSFGGTAAPIRSERLPRKAMEVVALLYPDGDFLAEDGLRYPEYSLDHDAAVDEPAA